MVMPVPRGGGGPPIAIATPQQTEFPSTNSPQNWYTLPSYNSPIMNTDNNTLGIPWNNLITFISTRAAFLTTLQNQVDSNQSAITTLQGQVSTLQGQISTINAQIAALQSTTATHTSQIATLQGQVATLQGQVATLQSQVAVLIPIIQVVTVAALPPASAHLGSHTNVSDSSVTTFATPVAGGGSSVVPVFSDGTNWLVG